MVIVMKTDAPAEAIRQVELMLLEHGLRADISQGVEKTVIGAIGATDVERAVLLDQLACLPEVERVLPVTRAFKRASRESCPEGSTVRVGAVALGEHVKPIVVIAGPCSVESREQVIETAHAVKAAGARVLRGGAFKPRTLPYDFQGLGRPGLEYLAEARELTGLPVVTEVMAPEDVPLVGEYTDVFQVGARNMQNFPLLRALGGQRKPVLFKRGMAATLDEYLKAAEYILAGGNDDVILCERGIRGFDSEHYRNVFDLTALPALRELTHLPLVADPSHATGRWELVGAMAKAAVAAGCDGLMLEVHPDPKRARSDGRQALTPATFEQVMAELAPVAAAVGRSL